MRRKIMKSKMPERLPKQAISAVDLFCGVGGLTYGLARGGVNVAAGIDLDKNCQFPYEANNRATFVERDIRSVETTDVENLFVPQTLRLLAGCAPCQPFSTYSQKGRGTRQDGKWDLVLSFGKLIESLQPEFVTMENVPQLANHQVFDEFKRSLSGYHIWYDVVECLDYGIPQTRKRLVLLASQLGPISLIAPTHKRHQYKTVRDAIEALEPLDAGASDESDKLHMACSLSALNKRRIKASRPGGTWRDWPPSLRTDCHLKASGATYPSVYGRMEWDKPSPTITTQCFGYGNGRFGHPDQDRAISLREAALIQTFPKSYKFIRSGSRPRFNILGRLIGNAVPVRIGEIVAKSFIKHMSDMDRAT